jgi:hypothetical protein
LNLKDDIELKVLLLGIYKKKDSETLLDIVKILENNKIFSLKQGKKYLKKLKSLKYISNNTLTIIGIQKAKSIEMEFKI